MSWKRFPSKKRKVQICSTVLQSLPRGKLGDGKFDDRYDYYCNYINSKIIKLFDDFNPRTHPRTEFLSFGLKPFVDEVDVDIVIDVSDSSAYGLI